MNLSRLSALVAQNPALLVNLHQVVWTQRILFAKVTVVAVLIVLADPKGGVYGWIGEASSAPDGPLATGFGPAGSRQALLKLYGG